MRNKSYVQGISRDAMTKITSFSQFSPLRRFLLRLGLDKPTPVDFIELFLLSNILGIEARHLVVPTGEESAETEQAMLSQANSPTIKHIAELQHLVREELAHRKQAVSVIVAMLAVVVAILAAIAASFSAKSSSQSAATAQTAVNIIFKR